MTSKVDSIRDCEGQASGVFLPARLARPKLHISAATEVCRRTPQMLSLTSTHPHFNICDHHSLKTINLLYLLISTSSSSSSLTLFIDRPEALTPSTVTLYQHREEHIAPAQSIISALQSCRPYVSTAFQKKGKPNFQRYLSPAALTMWLRTFQKTMAKGPPLRILCETAPHPPRRS